MDSSVHPQESAAAGAESIRTPPGPALRGQILAYHGYRLPEGRPRSRLEIPDGVVTVVIALAGGLSLTADGPPQGASSFLSGLRTTATRGEHTGGLHGIEVTFSPLGAYRTFGIPMRHFTEAFTDLSDLLGQTAGVLVEQLRQTASWAERFALLDAVFTSCADRGGAVSPEVREALRLLRADSRPEALTAVSRQVGWSDRHLRACFGQQVGLAPKAVARVARLQRALRLQALGLDGAAVAASGGCHDQAHCIREFKAMTGLTPSQFAARRGATTEGTGSDWEAVSPFFHGRWNAAAQRHQAASRPDNPEAVTLFAAAGAFDPRATRAALAGCGTAVLLLAGEFDVNSPPRSVAESAALFPGATFVVQRGAGHYPWLDDAERFVATTAAFLA
ncbi:helix-turn-helix domain-containing protein [Streptomyces avidinii]|uniref:helix-turn-helix domain-containing protein n=1 Tax=Streptomyces avidinii TaxID=1895 RepID=UPI00378B33E2